MDDAMKQPPVFAGRILTRLVPSQNHTVLLGDLSEEYRRGRTTTWYWLQILAAVVVGTWKDIRTHKGLALRAAVVGISSTLVLIRVALAVGDVATGAGFMWGTTWIGLPRYWHYPYDASWSYRAFNELEWILTAMASGWIVVRSHRRHGVTMILAFLAGLVALRIANLAMVPGPIVNFRWWAFAQSWSFEALWILLGGYLATRREATA